MGKMDSSRCKLLFSWRLWPLYVVVLIAVQRLRQDALVHQSDRQQTAHSHHAIERDPGKLNNESNTHRAHSDQETNRTHGGTNVEELREDQVLLLGSMQPRAFPFSNFSGAHNTYTNATTGLPCFPPNPLWRTSPGRPTATGLLFSKSEKVGGSTTAGVHLRIARNAADRQNQNFTICHTGWMHGRAQNRYKNRNKEQSLLWTVLRDPTRRLVSMFYHFYVARRGVQATADNFRKHIVEEKHDTYLETVAFRHERGHLNNHSAMIESILYDYDFVAVTERMDESLLALSLLWRIPLADVLYLSAKKSGSYDGGGGGGCHIIPKGEITAGMQEIIESKEFQSLIRWDRIAHQLANRSLDKTIDETIGRDKFNQVYTTYRHALQLAQERCAPEVVAPCTGGGILRESSSSSSLLHQYDNNMTNTVLGQRRKYADTDCLSNDAGCGYMCLDDVATELNLWDSAPPMQYRFPNAFGLGLSSRQRLANKSLSKP